MLNSQELVQGYVPTAPRAQGLQLLFSALPSTSLASPFHVKCVIPPIRLHDTKAQPHNKEVKPLARTFSLAALLGEMRRAGCPRS